MPALVKLNIRNAIAHARAKLQQLRARTRPSSYPGEGDHLDARTRETADAIEALVLVTEQMLDALNRPQRQRRKPARRMHR